MIAFKAARKLTKYLAKLEAKGVQIGLTSCCCKEAIRVSSGASTCKIEEVPGGGWEISGD